MHLVTTIYVKWCKFCQNTQSTWVRFSKTMMSNVWVHFKVSLISLILALLLHDHTRCTCVSASFVYFCLPVLCAVLYMPVLTMSFASQTRITNSCWGSWGLVPHPQTITNALCCILESLQKSSPWPKAYLQLPSSQRLSPPALLRWRICGQGHPAGQVDDQAPILYKVPLLKHQKNIERFGSDVDSKEPQCPCTGRLQGWTDSTTFTICFWLFQVTPILSWHFDSLAAPLALHSAGPKQIVDICWFNFQERIVRWTGKRWEKIEVPILLSFFPEVLGHGTE